MRDFWCAGAESCTSALSVESDAIQPTPAGRRSITAIGSERVALIASAATPYAAIANDTIVLACACARHFWRSTAPVTAPTPIAPSIMP